MKCTNRPILCGQMAKFLNPVAGVSDANSLTSEKVKIFRCKPGMALGVPGGQGSWIFSTFGTMKVVRSSPPGVFLVLIFRG